jgi:hypothetical protein
MDFLRRLFGGAVGSSTQSSVSGDPDGLYFYVQPRGCDEIVRVRINRMNDLSLNEQGDRYWVHKLARGVRCRENVEIDFYFDMNRRLVEHQIKNGTLVDQATYDAWMASQQAD